MSSLRDQQWRPTLEYNVPIFKITARCLVQPLGEVLILQTCSGAGQNTLAIVLLMSMKNVALYLSGSLTSSRALPNYIENSNFFVVNTVIDLYKVSHE